MLSSFDAGQSEVFLRTIWLRLNKKQRMVKRVSSAPPTSHPLNLFNLQKIQKFITKISNNGEYARKKRSRSRTEGRNKNTKVISKVHLPQMRQKIVQVKNCSDVSVWYIYIYIYMYLCVWCMCVCIRACVHMCVCFCVCV